MGPTPSTTSTGITSIVASDHATPKSVAPMRPASGSRSSRIRSRRPTVALSSDQPMISGSRADGRRESLLEGDGLAAQAGVGHGHDDGVGEGRDDRQDDQERVERDVVRRVALVEGLGAGDAENVDRGDRALCRPWRPAAAPGPPAAAE